MPFYKKTVSTMLRFFKMNTNYKKVEGFSHQCELFEAGLDFIKDDRLCDTTVLNEIHVDERRREETRHRSEDKERLLAASCPSAPIRCCLEINKKDVDLLYMTRLLPIQMMERHYRRRNAVFETDEIQREGLALHILSKVNSKYI